MNKPVSAVVFLLLMLTIFGAGLYFILQFHFTVNFQKPQSPLFTYRPVTTDKTGLFLKLSSPEDNTVVYQQDLLIQGKTAPKATVILSSEDQDQILDTTSEGDFSITIKLEEMVNRITLIAIDNNNKSLTESRTVFYSTDEKP